jgi:hypothetical protein
MDESSVTPAQRRDLALARIRWNMRLTESRSREVASLVESCAIIASDAGIPADEALGLVVELLPAYRASAFQCAEIFADVYRQRRPRD